MMNKRQLKKISKNVARALKSLCYEDFHFNGYEYGVYREFIGWEGEHTEEFEEVIQILWNWFFDSITIQNPDKDDDELPEIIVYPKGFNSLSEINQIHYMISLLESSSGVIND